MSMPLIERVDQTGFHNPCTWTLRTTKGKVVYVRYARRELTCRYDNEYNGRQFFVKLLNAVDKMDTEDMFKITKFKVDHKGLTPSVIRKD